MKNNETNKKEWVKNAIIVFLVIMLLLTLFSNTITNYTLPQVSVSQVVPGSVSLSIRGSGSVEAGESYSVKATESRTILSVDVAKGDHVELGDALFELQDADSAELTKARDELAALELTYYKSLLTTKMSADAARAVNNNGASSFNSYIARIDELEGEIAATEDLVKEKQQIVDNLNVGKSVEAVNQISNNYSAKLESTLAGYAKEDAQTAFNNSKTDLKNELNIEKSKISNDISNAQSYLTTVRTTLNALNTNKGGSYAVAIGVATTISDFDTIYKNLNIPNPVPASNPELIVLVNEYSLAYSNYKSALSGYNSLDSLLDKQEKITNSITAIDSVDVNEDGDYKAALERLRAATLNADAVTYQNEKTNANYAAATTYATEDLTKAQNELKDLQTEMSNLINDISNSLDADKTSDDIVRKKEEIAKLEAKAMGASITAPVTGTVFSISKAAGEQMKTDEELCVIIPDGKDMTISISVTNANAKKINIGDTATLANSWAYPDAVCVVKSITDDPNDPANKSVVKFVITGDGVKIGQNMNLTLEADNKNYDKIVPNAAIKHDNSGDFVYALVEKSSPLGNRYYAKKVTINKMAQDDNKTAISGDIDQYTSVITGSNKTPEAGKQVRLSESSAN